MPLRLTSCCEFPTRIMDSRITNYTLNSIYNEVTFNEKSDIMKENLCTKYLPFTYKYIALNKKLPITRENIRIYFFVIGRVECIILKNCAKEGLVVTTLWLMRGKFVGWTSSIMNLYRTKVGRSIKEEKKLAKHPQEKQGSNKYKKILEETIQISSV